MDRWTHREYRTRLAWLDEQWNQPSRSDQYLMQIALEIRSVLAKNPRAIKMDHFKLDFGRAEEKPTLKLSKKQTIKATIARWAGFVGLKRESRKK